MYLWNLLQIVILYLAYRTGSATLVWVTAISYILCLNSWPLRELKEAVHPDHESQVLLPSTICLVSS